MKSRIAVSQCSAAKLPFAIKSFTGSVAQGREGEIGLVRPMLSLEACEKGFSRGMRTLGWNFHSFPLLLLPLPLASPHTHAFFPAHLAKQQVALVSSVEFQAISCLLLLLSLM